MSYSELELDSNFAINSVSDFDSGSESDPESDSSLAFMNLDICISLFCICTLLNKRTNSSFIHPHNRINSYASNASIMHILFWHFIS